MELEIESSVESAVVLDDSFKEINQQPEILMVPAQRSEAETNGYGGKCYSCTELKLAEPWTDSSTILVSEDADREITCLEDELKRTSADLELLAVQHESDQNSAQEKIQNAEMRLVVAQEVAAAQIKEADRNILFLENEFQEVKTKHANAAADQLKLRSVEGESAILTEESLTSQSRLSALEGNLEMTEQRVQQLITEIETSTEKVYMSEVLLAAAEVKTKEIEDRLALEIGCHQEEMKEMALKQENLMEFKEKLEVELETCRKEKFDVENDLKLALEKADEHCEQLMLKEQLAKDSLDRLRELQNAIDMEKATVKDTEQTIFSLQCEIDELKGQVAAGAEREAVLRETELQFTKLKQDYDSAQINSVEVVAKLHCAEMKLEEQLCNLEAYEENAIRAREKVSELERKLNTSEVKLKSAEELVGTLHTELHDLKLSAATDTELFKETKTKSAQLEEELLSKLKASEERYQDLEMSFVQLTESSFKLEESLDTLKIATKSGDMKIRELEIKIEDLQHIKEGLEEKLRTADESLSHHENSAKQSMDRAMELDMLITKHQTEAHDASNRAAELDATLLKVQERNTELEVLLKSSDDKSIELGNEVKLLTERASELEEFVNVLKSEVNNSVVHVDEVQLSLTNSRQREQELLEKLEITEERLLEQENNAKRSTSKVAELDGLIAGMETEINGLKGRVNELELELGSADNAMVKANELELALVNSNEKEQELLRRLEIFEERHLQQESTSKFHIDRVAELDELIAAMESEMNGSRARANELELELGNATQKAAVLEEELKDSELKSSVLENAVKELKNRLDELGGLLEVANAQVKGATDKAMTTELALLAEQQQCRQAEAVAKDLYYSLCELKEKIVHLETDLTETTTKCLEAESKILELQPLVGKLEEAESLASSLNERICAAEERANRAETYLHTVTLNESKLRDEHSSHQVVMGSLQTSLSQAESEKRELTDQIDSAIRRSSELSEQLMQETQLLKETEMLVSTLQEKLAATEEKANKSEADAFAAVLSESKLRDELSSQQTLIQNLQISLSQNESEKQALDDQIDSTSRKFNELKEQLMQERQSLQEAGMLISSLNEKIASAEERAHKSEADVHATIVSENNLKDELSSFQILISSLQASLSQVESEKQSLVGQIDIATRNLSELNEQLMQERQQLKAAENFASVLNEKIFVAEERANRAEADMHAVFLHESELSDELSSHRMSIGTLQMALSQVESEKEALASQIGVTTRSFNVLNEKLIQEWQQLQLQMVTMAQENRDLMGNDGSLHADMQEAFSEIEASATQFQECSLTEAMLDSELQIQKSKLVKTCDDCAYVAKQKLEQAVPGDALQFFQAQLDQFVVMTKSLINKLAVAEEEKAKLKMENGALQKAVQNKENIVAELKREAEKLHVTDEPDVGSMKSRDFTMDFTASSATTRRRKGVEVTSVTGENLALETNENGKANHPESRVANSQLLFYLCVISMLLFSGFWIARKVYL